MEVTELVEQFVDHSLKHLKLSYVGDWKNGNKEVKKVTSIYKKIREIGPQAMEKLIDLTESDSDEVILMAAVYGITHNSVRCLKALHKLADKELPHLSFAARQTIENWKNGKINLD